MTVHYVEQIVNILSALFTV